MKRAELIVITLLVSGCLSITACGDKKPAPRKPEAQKSQQAPAAPAATAQKDEIKAEKEVYVYDPKGRRDPFVPLTDLEKEKPQKRKGAAPIEDYDVDEIKVIAIAWDSQQYFAMITLPDKKSYTIKRGMTLGLYGGKVREITRDSVIITEQVKDYRGQIKTKDTILKLRKEGEE
jgi:type IV pilus assembly protein PilP